MATTVPCLNPETCGVKSHEAGSASHIECTKRAFNKQKNGGKAKEQKKSPSVAPPVKPQSKTEFVSGRRLAAEDKELLQDVFEQVYGKGDSLVDYSVKKTSGYMRLPEGIVVMDKHDIQTRFWFGESGYDYDEVAETANKAGQSEQYFIDENMRHLPATRRLEDVNDGYKVFVVDEGNNNPIPAIRLARYQDQIEDHYDKYAKDRSKVSIREMTEEELGTYKEFLQSEINAFEKRLHSYLKRYGMSKVSASTYWRDR